MTSFDRLQKVLETNDFTFTVTEGLFQFVEHVGEWEQPPCSCCLGHVRVFEEVLFEGNSLEELLENWERSKND